MGATAYGRWLRPAERLLVMIGLVLFLAGCASPKSVELATQTATTVDTFTAEVSKAFEGAHSCVLALRKYEEGQWRSLIGTLDLALEEYAPVLEALDQNPRPEYLARVSSETQKTYRQRLEVENRLAQLVQRLAERREELGMLRTQGNEANALLAKEPPSDTDIKSAKEKWAGVYRQLMKVPLASAESLDPPENYEENLADVRAMAKAYAEEVAGQLRYCEKWQKTFQERLDAFLTRMDDTTKQLRANVEKLRAKKAELEAQEKAFGEAVDKAMQELAATKEGLLQHGQMAGQLARATVDSIRYDVQIAAIMTKALDVGLRVTTGLSVAGLISQRDSQQISTLIGTTGEVMGIIRGTTEWESERTAKDAKAVESGSGSHG